MEKQWPAARSVLEQEMPEVVETLEMEYPQKADKSDAVCGNEGLKEIMLLQKEERNWCRVYYEIKMSWKALKGLPNRERIWKEVEDILRRIDLYHV